MRALVYNAGVLTANWTSEKSAKMNVSLGIGPGGPGLLTRNDKRLASHNEDDLHRTKLNQSQLSPLIESES